MKRLSIIILLVFAAIIAVALYRSVAPVTPSRVEERASDATVFFELGDTNVFISTDCVLATWRVENIQAVKFENRGVVGEGSGAVCDAAANLEVEFRNGDSRSYVIAKETLINRLGVRIAVVAAITGVLAALFMLGLPLILIRWWQSTPLIRALNRALPDLRIEGSATPGPALILCTMVAVLLLAAVFRTAYLSAPIRTDEAWTYLVFVSKPLGVAISDYSAPNNHIFHTLLAYLTTSLFGAAAWSLRLPSYWAGLVLLPLTFQLGRRLYGPPVGLLAAGLLAGSSYVIEWSTLARGYMLQTLIFVGLLLIANELRKRSRVRDWVLFSLLAALGLATVPTSIYALAIVVGWLLLCLVVTWRGRRRLRALRDLSLSLLLGAILTFVMYVPVVMFVLTHEIDRSEFNNINSVNWSIIVDSFGTQAVVTLSYWQRDLPNLLNALLALGLFLSLIFHAKLARYPFHLTIVALVVLPPILFIHYVLTYARLWTFLMPAYYVLGFSGLVYLIRLLAPRRIWPKIAVLSIPAALVLAAGTGLTTLASESVIHSWEGRSIGAEQGIEAIQAQRQDSEPVLCVRICLQSQFYASLNSVPMMAYNGDAPLPTEPFFLIVYIDRDQHTLEQGLDFLGHSREAVATSELIYESVDSAVYFVTPADA